MDELAGALTYLLLRVDCQLSGRSVEDAVADLRDGARPRPARSVDTVSDVDFELLVRAATPRIETLNGRLRQRTLKGIDKAATAGGGGELYKKLDEYFGAVLAPRPASSAAPALAVHLRSLFPEAESIGTPLVTAVLLAATTGNDAEKRARVPVLREVRAHLLCLLRRVVDDDVAATAAMAATVGAAASVPRRRRRTIGVAIVPAVGDDVFSLERPDGVVGSKRGLPTTSSSLRDDAGGGTYASGGRSVSDVTLFPPSGHAGPSPSHTSPFFGGGGGGDSMQDFLSRRLFALEATVLNLQTQLPQVAALEATVLNLQTQLRQVADLQQWQGQALAAAQAHSAAQERALLQMNLPVPEHPDFQASTTQLQPLPPPAAASVTFGSSASSRSPSLPSQAQQLQPRTHFRLLEDLASLAARPDRRSDEAL